MNLAMNRVNIEIDLSNSTAYMDGDTLQADREWLYIKYFQ